MQWAPKADYVTHFLAPTLLGAVAIPVAALAGVELRGQYAVRRGDAAPQHARITRVSLWLAWVIGVAALLIWFISWAHA